MIVLLSRIPDQSSMDTLKQSAEKSVQTHEKRRKRTHRHKPRSRPSFAISSQEDYETMFPSLSATPIVQNTTLPVLPQLSYSEITARQFEIVAMGSDVCENPSKSSEISNCYVPRLKQSRNLSHAVNSWLVGSTRSTALPIRNMRLPSANIRPSFDIFSMNTEPIAKPVAKKVSTLNKFEIVTQLRSSLSKVADTTLLLPDYHLYRLIQSNPTLSSLIQQSKSNRILTKQF